ncbi:MAG: PKD domain-containing protein [bacterium]|nr:PKD domain-containing protein [bacterium]
MKKKKFGFNSKILFTITLFFLVFCFMVTTTTFAAKKVKFNKEVTKNVIAELNKTEGIGIASVGQILGLTGDEELSLLRSRMDFNRITHNRYQQTYMGIPVWGHQTVISRGHSNEVVGLHGNMILDIANDISSVPGFSTLDPKGALERMKTKHKKIDKNATWNFENEQYGTYFYINEKGKANLCYVVSFFADNENGNPSRFIYFIKVKNSKVIHSFNMLNDADGTGPGGNQKIGQYTYGPTGDYPAFGVTQNGSTCTMSTTDVKTVNLNHSTSGSTAYSYTCFENTHKEINGAYCPLNDAQYFGQVVYDMYQDWYGLPVLPFQLMMRVHYSTNYENAFWNGSSMTFGDGASTFHPLVCLDVSAHEVAHGFTENHSNLIYSGQSGGINEAYSDMAGEAAENYSRGSNDFMCGYDIFKAAGQALRYLYDPPLDGISIDHVDDYYSGMNVHYSSGVYNKAFWVLATTTGWDTHKAFDVFTKANTDYWTSGTTFQQGAEGVQDAAEDYGYSCADVRDAFAVVGITLVCTGGPPVAEFSGTPTSGGYPLTVSFTDLSTNTPTSWSWNFGDSGTSTAEDPGHTYTTAGTYTVQLTVTNAYGSDTETKTNYITVTAPLPPVANFTASTTNPYTGQTVNFTDTTTNSPTSWSWTFAGGSPGTSTAQNPSVVYNTVGTYTVALTATNAAGSDTETKTGYITVTDAPLEYCSSQGNNYSYEYIGNVTVDAFSNTSGGSNYSDFTGMTAYLTGGDTVSVSLLPVFPSTTYTEFWKIWIDYNLDGDFTDAGEEVFSGSGTSTVTGSFTVASVEVTTRMRVSMKWDAAPTSCETFSYGEVEDYTVNITGAGPQYTLTTNTVGNGSITLNPPGGTYNDGTVVTVTAVPDSGWEFTGWSGDLSGSTNPTTITMDADKTVTATFTEIVVVQYTLTTNTVGNGSITLNPPGGTYDDGTVVTVTAAADSGWQFDNWSGDLSGSTNPTTITMNANKTVTANFSEVPVTYTVGNTTIFGSSTTTANRRAMPFTMPENGTISSVTMYHTGGSGSMILGVYDGEGLPANNLGVTLPTVVSGSTGWQTINLTNPCFVAGGTTVWLAWVYESNPGIYYETGSPGRAHSGDGWSGGMPDPFGSSTQSAYIYSIYADYTPSAPPQYTVTVNVVGNGSVALNPPGGTYDAGTEVTLTATADSGWQFDSWSGDLTGSTNPATITVNSDMTITVTFTEVGTTGEVGNTTVFGSTSTSAYRRAMPFTMPENGTITSVTMYHTGGSGNMILAVYDGEGTPANLLAVTPTTAIGSSTGWQTINLTSSVAVSSGQTVWLAWVYETNPGIRYQTGSPGRYQSTATWSGGMPDPFGSGSQSAYLYSIYATYNK